MEGRYAADAHAEMVRSAAGARMNMLRVWGGGIFLPESFYAAADELGVLLYHDMMFTTTSKTHEPSGSAEEAAELRNAIRRLAHRPCVALLALRHRVQTVVMAAWWTNSGEQTVPLPLVSLYLLTLMSNMLCEALR